MLKSVYIEWTEVDILNEIKDLHNLEFVKVRKKTVAHAILVHQNKERVILTPAVVDGKCIHLLIIPRKCITVYKEVDLKKGFIEKRKVEKKSKKEKPNNETKKSK